MRSVGAPVTIVQLTDGAASAGFYGLPAAEAQTVRIREAELVAKELGAELQAWKESDSALRASEANVRRLTALLDERRPQCVFAPFLSDPHPDHVATTQILAQSLRRCGLDIDRLMIASYEVWGLAPVNCYSNISGQFDRRNELLFKYKTAMKVVDYCAFCESLHGMRHVSWTGRAGYAEAFYLATARDYLKLFGAAPASLPRAA
jgi:LmbE family N-acetylglucosaminyl deacetylase